MSTDHRKPRRPADQLEAGRSFFSGMDLEVGHFAALWHSFKVGQLLAADMNRVARVHGLSIADFHLLGALMIDGAAPLRATDLAYTLQVSNAVLSGRIARLARLGLLARSSSETDRRANLLSLTVAGAEKVQAIGVALEQDGHFVQHYRRLPEADKQALSRIMGEMHTLMDRDFLPTSRPDPLGG